MSDDDLIRRGDAVAMLLGMRGPVDVPRTEKAVWVDEGIDRCIEELRALPAVTVGVPEATVYRAVLDWIRDDAGAAVKMSMTPDRANALTARILAALDLTPAPDAAAIREATARLHKLAYWLDTDAEVLADMDQRDLSDHQHIQAEVNAILALLPKGGA